MVLSGCCTVLLIFSNKEPTGGLPPSGGVAALVSAAAVHSLVAGLPGSGDTPSFRETLEEGGRKRIRLSRKTNVRKLFGVDPWEQFPNDGRLTL